VDCDGKPHPKVPQNPPIVVLGTEMMLLENPMRIQVFSDLLTRSLAKKPVSRARSFYEPPVGMSATYDKIKEVSTGSESFFRFLFSSKPYEKTT
jgi:hypothetical protein